MPSAVLIAAVALALCTAAAELGEQHRVHGPLTPHFSAWLKRNGYGTYKFERTDYGTQGSFGGQRSSSDKPKKTPVVFLHGNTDAALQLNTFSTGWSKSVAKFLQHGYAFSELYATSWADADIKHSWRRVHKCGTLTRLRAFIEAVLKYTRAPKISIVAHSMGASLGRRIIKGGHVETNDESCDLGDPIGDRVEVFLSISGAHYGICSCGGDATIQKPTCNNDNGFFPGDSCGLIGLAHCGSSRVPKSCGKPRYSRFLRELNDDVTKEADKVFSAWSYDDDLIQNGNSVWGRPTSLAPLSDGFVVYRNLTHMQTKDRTAVDQLFIVRNKRIPRRRTSFVFYFSEA